ncbi:MAG TPA: MXAN_5187 C-terminal domain-containing protein [Polyangiaceae bacterium]|nr:MXAN_5187 C-terminal domain-containing protein [Polyangiaceae bacterium]
MRWKIIIVNAGIVIVVGLLTYVLLATSLNDVLTNQTERKREVAQALRAANAQLALDALRMERWLEGNASAPSLRAALSGGTADARSEAATAEANRLRDAAVSEPLFAKMTPSLVLIVDAQGIAVGRNGSALMRGENVAAAYPSLTESLKTGRTSSALWINHKRQEQMLTSYAPLHGDGGTVLGALVVGTPLNDERLTRTSELTSGHTLFLASVSDTVEIVADSAAPPSVVAAANEANVTAATKQALGSGGVVTVDAAGAGNLFGAVPLDAYAGQTRGVLIAAVPASLVESLPGLLWPVFAVAGLGVLLVVVGGTLLGNYISGPVSELEDGLLAIINGNSELRFQFEHDELGGLVFRINSLLNAMMGVAEDTTDEQGRPSQGPNVRDFQEALAVDESSVAGSVDPNVATSLAAENADEYYRRLFDEYIAAKRQIGEPVEHITFDAFVGRIRASEAETSQKHGKPVRYQVQLRGNAVVLIAVPLS